MNYKKHASNYPEMEGWQIKSWPSAGYLERRAKSNPHICKRNPIVSFAIPQPCQTCSLPLFYIVECKQLSVRPIHCTYTVQYFCNCRHTLFKRLICAAFTWNYKANGFKCLCRCIIEMSPKLEKMGFQRSLSVFQSGVCASVQKGASEKIG